MKCSDCFPRRRDKGEEKGDQTYFAILGQIDLEGLRIVFEPERGHGKENILSIDRFPFLLLTFFGCCATLATKVPAIPIPTNHVPSLVMNEMNSLTHSCIHSLASLAILALSGKAVFMIRATGAKLRMLASDIAQAEVEEEDDNDLPPWCRDDEEALEAKSEAREDMMCR